MYHSVGFTQGYGEFHFSNGIYNAISNYATRYCEPSAKKRRWGVGFRNRREVVRKCLAKIGLSEELIKHNIQREIFVIPLSSNSYEFLRGDHSKLLHFNQPLKELSSFFRERWLLPRSVRDLRYADWKPRMWSLWDGDGNV